MDKLIVTLFIGLMWFLLAVVLPIWVVVQIVKWAW
jgi:hypothetical protein